MHPLLPATLFPYLRERRGFRRLFAHDVAEPRDPARLPRRIFLFWDKGLSQAPAIVRHCAASWERMNPDWDVTVLDAAAAERALPRLGLRGDISVQHYSDVLRTALLLREGGVWADATCLCAAPLAPWLGLVFQQADFFAFDRPGRNRQLSNWFLASVPQGNLVRGWYRAQRAFWAPSRRPAPPYYANHHLFEHLVRFDRQARRDWAAVPRLAAEPPHRLQRLLSEGRKPTAEDLAIIRTSPVHKLSWKDELTVAGVQRLLDAAGGAAGRMPLRIAAE